MTETIVSPRRALSIACLLLLALASHWRALGAGFHLDDFFRATDNPGIESISPIGRHFSDPGTMATLPHLVQYRPLLPLSLSLTHAAAASFDIEPALAHHAGNLLLHLLATVLVFLLVRALKASVRRANDEPPSPFLAFAAAALFATHPVAGLAVHYVCNRDLLLALVFLLGALLAYTSAAKSPSATAWLACGLCLLGALLSRQNAALFPLIALAHELTIGRRTLREPLLWKRVGALTLFVAAYLAFVRYGIGFSDADQLIIAREPFEYPLTELRLHLFHYARNLVWPLALHPLPALEAATSFFNPGVLLGALFIAFAITAAWRNAHTRPLLAFSILAYFAWLSMTSSIVPMRSFAEDYRQVISLPFACVLGAACLAALPRAARYPSLALTALFLCLASNTNASHWQTEETLWGRATSLGTTSQGHLNYGRSILTKDPAMAETHFMRALELSPGNVYAKINLALLMVDTDRVEEGVTLAREAATSTPHWGVTQYWLARCFIAAGRPEEALQPALQAHNLEPSHTTYARFYIGLLHQRARTLQTEGQAPRALTSAWEAHELDPGHKENRELLATLLHEHALALQVRGEAPASLSVLEQLHSVFDHEGDSRFLHGWALQSAGSNAEALPQYRKHLELFPADTRARLNLAYALRDIGQRDEALAELRLIVSIDPDNADARNLLTSLGG